MKPFIANIYLSCISSSGNLPLTSQAERIASCLKNADAILCQSSRPPTDPSPLNDLGWGLTCLVTLLHTRVALEELYILDEDLLKSQELPRAKALKAPRQAWQLLRHKNPKSSMSSPFLVRQKVTQPRSESYISCSARLGKHMCVMNKQLERW